MLFHARAAQVEVSGTTMNYVEFGRGAKPLIILPGLGDGLGPVQGKAQAAALALSYRCFAREFKVYLFSRKNQLEAGCTTRSMAQDMAQALDALGLARVCVMGVSQGGMIAQWLAIDCPERVEKLVVGVSAARPNELLNTGVRRWMGFAQKGDHKALMIDTCQSIYTPKTQKRYKLLYPFMGSMGRPKSFDRFLNQAGACLTHNTYDELKKVICPTLILAGGADRVVGVAASQELAQQIKGSRLVVYEGQGHAAYEEVQAAFNGQVLEFLRGNTPPGESTILP